MYARKGVNKVEVGGSKAEGGTFIRSVVISDI